MLGSFISIMVSRLLPPSYPLAPLACLELHIGQCDWLGHMLILCRHFLGTLVKFYIEYKTFPCINANFLKLLRASFWLCPAYKISKLQLGHLPAVGWWVNVMTAAVDFLFVMDAGNFQRFFSESRGLIRSTLPRMRRSSRMVPVPDWLENTWLNDADIQRCTLSIIARWQHTIYQL